MLIEKTKHVNEHSKISLVMCIIYPGTIHINFGLPDFRKKEEASLKHVHTCKEQKYLGLNGFAVFRPVKLRYRSQTSALKNPSGKFSLWLLKRIKCVFLRAKSNAENVCPLDDKPYDITWSVQRRVIPNTNQWCMWTPAPPHGTVLFWDGRSSC